MLNIIKSFKFERLQRFLENVEFEYQIDAIFSIAS